MIVVYNGLNYYAPATPKEIVRLISVAFLVKTQLNDAIKQVEGILDAVPPSDAKLAITACLKHMGGRTKVLGRGTPHNQHSSYDRHAGKCSCPTNRGVCGDAYVEETSNAGIGGDDT